MTDTADILERAADLIEPEGAWMQEDYCDAPSIDRATCWCATGAIAKVLNEPGSIGEEWADDYFWPLIADDYLISGKQRFCGTVDWNDASERTQAQVVTKLREAAAKARGEQS